jgi:arginase
MHAPPIGLKRVSTIAVNCGAGARDTGCKDGPGAFQRHWDRSPCTVDTQLVWEWMPEGLCMEGAAPLDSVARTARWLATATGRLTERGRRCLVIGGDHSCAIGTWSGVSRAMRSPGPLGLIWVDAHMDMHVPETTHSGAINGMPIAALLGYGSSELTGLAGGRPALDPDRVCLVGARSFEPEEVAFAQRHGVRVIGMDEVARRGVADSLAEARAIVTRGTAGYGMSLDLDAFDPTEAPGVGTPAPGGIHVREFLDIWTDLTSDPACRAIEIVEYNPHRDQAGRTVRLLGTLVATAVGEERLQWTG